MKISFNAKRKRTALSLPSFLLFLLIGLSFFFSFLPIADAQIGRPGDDVVPQIPDPFNPPNPIDRPNPPTPDENGVGNGRGGNVEENTEEQPTIVVGDGVVNTLYVFVIRFGGWIVNSSGALLDSAIENFILKFGEVYLTWGVGVAVEDAWTIIRDILNMSFIFALVYIGLKLIFNADDTSAKRSLGSLLIAALLINFSLFISKFIIDLANSLASLIYYQGLKNATEGISSVLLGMLGTSTIFNVPVLDLTAQTGTSVGLAVVFGTFIFLLVTAYVFLAFAIMIFIRSIILFFLMIFSPLMFIGLIFSDFQKYSHEYISRLLGNAFFAPAAIFMLYLSVSIMQAFKYQFEGTQTGSLGLLFTTQDYALGAQALMIFVLGIGLLLASLQVAKKLGAVGSSTAISFGNGLKKRALGGMSNMGKFGLGAGVGVGARMTRGGIDKAATSNNAVARAVGRGLTKYTGLRDSADKAYKSSPQGKMAENRKARSQGLATRTADTRAKQGIADNATAGGPALERAVRDSNQTQLIESLRKHKETSTEYQNIVSAMTQTQINDLAKAKDDEFSPQERSSLLKTVTGGITKRITASGSIDTTKVPSLTFDELETLGDDWLTNPANLKLLTFSQVEKLAKDSKVLGTSQKAAFKDTWKTTLQGDVSTRAIENAMKGRSPKEIVKLPDVYLTSMAAIPYLNESVLKEIAEAKKPQSVINTIDSNMRRPGAESSGQDYITRPTNKHRDKFW